MIIMSCNSNTTGATSGAGTAYTSGASDLTLDFSGAQCLVFCVYCFVDYLLFFYYFYFGHCILSFDLLHLWKLKPFLTFSIIMLVLKINKYKIHLYFCFDSFFVLEIIIPCVHLHSYPFLLVTEHL